MKRHKKNVYQKITDGFGIFSRVISKFAGSPWVFTSAFFFIIIWFSVGPIFGFSDTWQLFVNTLTTIITFLMVFLIQNSQNRDFDSMELKLDELIHSLKNSSSKFIDVEDLPDKEIDKLKKKFNKKS